MHYRYIKYSVLFFLNFLLPSFSYLLKDDEFEGQSSLYVYHSLDPTGVPSDYFLRGVITIYPTKNEATYMQGKPISDIEIKKLKKLVATNDLYHLKLASRLDAPSNESVFSFTKACAIFESAFADVIIITIDQGGVPVGVSVSAAQPNCHGSNMPSSRTLYFNTSVHLVTLTSGPVPDTLTYIQRLEQEKAEKARGEQGDNRSFFAKYWMYIVPVVIFLFISGASGPEGQQGSGR